MEKAEKGNKDPNIDVFRAWCKGCGICVAFCPSGALAKDETGQPFVQDASKCIRCGWCEMRCPDFAITVQNKRDDNGQASEGEA